MILFRDGLEVEGELLQREWRLPARKLVIAMPVTARDRRARRARVVGLDWTYAFLVGALLSPTDPVLTSGVVTNPRVPRIVRHSLNLESGLNDGLALRRCWRSPPRSTPVTRRTSCGGSSCSRTSASGSPTGSPSAGSRRAAAARRPGAREHARTSGRCSGSASPSRPTAWRCSHRTATASSPCSCARSRSACDAPRCALVRRARGRDRGDRQARRVRRVRLGADLRRRCSGTAGRRSRSAAITLLVARPVAIWIALGGPALTSRRRHFIGVVRPEGHRHRDLLADSPQQVDPRRRARSSTWPPWSSSAPCSCTA